MSTGTSTDMGGAAGIVRPGEVLSGKYRIEQVLGEGGMGVVVAATHLQLDEKVAIKLILPEAARSRDVVDRFLREARAAVKIKSEHVVRVSDVGTLDSGMPFMVMEYLTGHDLAHVLQASGPQPIPVAVEYVLQACEALAEAHSMGIVHRDLKPANLFLTKRADGSPCVKVLDFGISKIEVGNQKSMTSTSAVMGSPMYMSPEQMKSSRNVDARTDIWALGVILYELLAGVPPYDAETVPMLCVKVMQEPPPPLRAARPDVPPALEAVILRCHEKDPEQRFRHIGELAEALAPFVSGRAHLSAQRVMEIARTTAQQRNSLHTPMPISQATAPIHVGGGHATANPIGATMLAQPDAAAFAASGAGRTAAASTAASWSGAASTGNKTQRKSAAIPIAAAIGALLVVGGLVALVALRKGHAEPAAPALHIQPAAITTLAPDPKPVPNVTPALPSETGETTTAAALPESSANAAEPQLREKPTNAASKPPKPTSATQPTTPPATQPTTPPATQPTTPPATQPTTPPATQPTPPLKPPSDLFGDRK